jgi:cyclophilin family peptidyl-prolyl cis-trans isomerase
MSISATTTIISIPTLEGDLIVELFDSFAPRACKYFIDILSNPQLASNLSFSRRDSLKAVCCLNSDNSSSSSFLIPSNFFFAEELEDESARRLKFTGAGIIGVSCEPDLKTNAFFVSLAPMMMTNSNNNNSADVSSSSIVIGRVLQGMNSVLGYLIRANCDGNGSQLISPLRILRSAKIFLNQEIPARPRIVQRKKEAAIENISQKKKSSLLDSMFGDDEDE